MKVLIFIIYAGLGVEIIFRLLSRIRKANPKAVYIAKKYKDLGGVMVVAAVFGIAIAHIIKSVIDESIFIWINELIGLSIALLIIIKYWRYCAGYDKHK